MIQPPDPPKEDPKVLASCLRSVDAGAELLIRQHGQDMAYEIVHALVLIAAAKVMRGRDVDEIKAVGNEAFVTLLELAEIE